MIQLFKKYGTYKDKKDENKEKRFVNFYVLCGDRYIPVEIVFFPNREGKDLDYSARKAVLEAFATLLPDKPD